MSNGCMLLMKLSDSVSEDHEHYHTAPQKFDVVTVVPDWWHPGSLDITDGDTLFIYCPDMDYLEGQIRFRNSEKGNPKDNPHLRFRSVFLNPDLFPDHHKKSHEKIESLSVHTIEDGVVVERAHKEIWDEGKEKGFFITMSKSELLAAKQPKKKLENLSKISHFNPFYIT